jgi:nitrogen fixation/metabolism regulation signal transduction histidine kinase
LKTITDVQAVANAITVAAVMLSLLAGMGAVLMLRHLLNRPLERLIGQVASVAEGDHHHRIDTAGRPS